MSAEEAIDLPIFSSERIRLLCKIVDVFVEAYNIAVKLVSSKERSNEEPDMQRPDGVGIINCCGKVFVIITRSYIEGRIRKSGIGLNRNTLRDVMKEFIDNKISGINIVESIDDLFGFFVETCNRARPSVNKDSVINKIRYELGRQLGRLPPHNTWFVIIDADELKSDLESVGVAMMIIQHMKDGLYYKRLDTLMEILQDEGVNAIMLKDVLTMCAIIKLIGSPTS